MDIESINADFGIDTEDEETTPDIESDSSEESLSIHPDTAIAVSYTHLTLPTTPYV